MTLILANLMSVLSIAANRPNVSPAIPEWLDAIAAFLIRGDAAKQDLMALTDQIRTMVAEDRPPTVDEWTALRTRRQRASDELQSLDLSGG